MKQPIDILMIIALFIASLNLRPAINSIAPILETIQNDLGMSGSVASLLTSIPVLCMGLFSPVASKLGNRWGIERVIGWSLALIGVGTILRLFTNSTIFLLLTAFIAGVGIAAAGPLLSGFIKRHFSANVPSMIGVYTVAMTLGLSLAAGLSAPLEGFFDSWRGSLAIWSVLAVIAVPIWWLFVMRHVKHHSPVATSQQTAKLPWGNKRALLLTLSFGLMSMSFYSISAWLPLIIQSLGYSKIYAGNVLTIFAAIQIPISFVIPLLLKRLPSRLLWLLVASILELIGFSMILLSIQPLFASILIGIGAGTLLPLNLLLPIDATESAQEAATWSAMTQSGGFVIGSIGPIIVGQIHDSTESFTFAMFGIMAIHLIMMAIHLVAVPRSSAKTKQTAA